MKRLSFLLVFVLLLCTGCGHVTTTPQTTVSPQGKTCTVSIVCTELLDNPDLSTAKTPFVPKDGYILHETTMEIFEGDTVYDILRRACNENECSSQCSHCKKGIHLETATTPGSKAQYVQGIHQLYEKDAGPLSGWIFHLNGEMPNEGAGTCRVQDGDHVEWIYSCEIKF